MNGLLKFLGLMLLATLFAISPAAAETYRVADQQEYRSAADRVQAGDTIVLTNGEWRDFDMAITGQGAADDPIIVRAEEAGKVVLTGQSSLRIGGRHIVVTGLVFRDGYSPRGEVVSFRRTKQDVAHYSRVTQVVIDGFSKPDRYESDYWVGIYGSNNRFDRNWLAGKTNKGVTLAVRLDTEESRDNGHRIDHNYFGPRPVLGSNGGETLRIGTSRYSMFDSGTLVENNVFDRCDGEVEIISAKSGLNVFRGNLFLRSRGTLTLRHGDNNVVERNVFMGHGKEHTGGIRVINRGQIVRGNYMEGLRGTGFSSALAVMNGVPNSPVNRYVQVEDARIERNTIIDSARIGFGIGADEERSAPIVSSTFASNLLGASGEGTFIEVDAPIDGLAFNDNRLLSGKVHSALPDIAAADTALERGPNGLLYPVDPALADIGAPRDLDPVALEDVGPAWYPKPQDEVAFDAGPVIPLAAGEGLLATAIADAPDGAIIELGAGDHVTDRTVPLSRTITLRGPAAGEPAVLKFGRPTLIELRTGANLKLDRVTIDGELAPDSVGNSVIRTTAVEPVRSNMEIELREVAVTGLVVNKSFNVLTLGKSTLANRVTITDSAFSDITGTIVSAAAETEDFGQYNVEYLVMRDNSFADIGGPVADIYRGGRDESTFGPNVAIVGNALAGVGNAATNTGEASIRLHGVQIARIMDNAIANSKPLRVVHTVGTPRTVIEGNAMAATPAPVLEEIVFDGPFRADMSRNTVDGEPIE